MWSFPALVYARGLCAWPAVFVRCYERGALWAWDELPLPGNVPVAPHLSSAELQPLGKFE